MDHVVYVDAAAKEMEKLVDGSKCMILRGAAGRKLPHGRVTPGDVLYFVRNNGEGKVCARAEVKRAISTDKLTPEESNQMIMDNQDRLQLTPQQVQRWGGKRFLVLIEVENVTAIEPFEIDRSQYGNMDDWLPVEQIEAVKVA